MIYIQKLKWSNWFSYGEDNELDFTETSLLQICGSNGAGKSSIPIILEETLFGKNSKGIKKADIPNRAIDGCAVDSEVYFSLDDIQYVVKLHRKGASTKLMLFSDGEDISSHTATGTYKQISNILGLDYKLYTQLTYQSSTSSLQFLKATDTERKKFLISLFDLDQYLDLHEIFKSEHKDLSSKTTYISGQTATSSTWLEKYKYHDMSEHELEEIPLADAYSMDKLAELKTSLTHIKKINEDVNKNNEYKRKIAEIDKDLLVYEDEPPIVSVVSEIEGDIKVGRADAARYTKEIKSLEAKGTDKTCGSCGQTIEAEDVADIVLNRRELLTDSKYKTDALSETLAEVKSTVAAYRKHRSVVDEFEKLSNYIDEDMSSDVLGEGAILSSIEETTAQILSIQKDIKTATAQNITATAHNTKLSIIAEEMLEHTQLLDSLFLKLESLSERAAIVQTLRDSFSTTGLITYKLEFVIKALEEEINEYLTELSSGRFQILFVLVKDKLNIEIIDNGTNISITALSTGELARVNTATVLAIRKLMSNISKTKLNLLFLDEIMGVLDEEGKDTLIALLMKENLNTLIVSHEFQHPLVPQVLVSKNSEDIASIEKVNG